MGILVLENGVKKSLSNDAFINKYGDHPQIARFSRNSIDIILEHINERQHPKHFTHDLNWEADFSVATVMSHRELFSQHQPIDDFDAKELLDLVADTISLKISLLNNPNSLSDTELLGSIKPALLQNAEYVALAGDYIVDQSHHRYREVSEGWLKLTI